MSFKYPSKLLVFQGLCLLLATVTAATFNLGFSPDTVAVPGAFAVTNNTTLRGTFALPDSARGMIVISNSSQTQTFSTSPAQLTNWALAWSGNRRVGGSLTNGTMVLTNAGVYLVNFGMSFSTAAAQTWTGELYLDEAATGIRFQKVTPATATTEVLRIMGLQSATAGQALTLRVNVAAATETMTIRCATMNVVQLPD